MHYMNVACADQRTRTRDLERLFDRYGERPQHKHIAGHTIGLYDKKQAVCVRV